MRGSLASGDTALLALPSRKLSENAPAGTTVAIEAWLRFALTRATSEEEQRRCREGG